MIIKNSKHPFGIKNMLYKIVFILLLFTGLNSLPGQNSSFEQSDSSIFDLTFIDFPAGGAEQAAVEYAADIWSSLLISPVPIHVEILWEDLEEEFTGRVQVVFEWNNGYPLQNTAYPPALGNALIGADARPNFVEFRVRINRNVDWYTGFDGNAGPTQKDLVTVALHEMGHGLGLTDNAVVDTATGIGGWGDPYPSILMRSIEDEDGNVIPDFYQNNSIELGSVLQSENVFLNLPLVKAANEGARVHLFAPETWVSGRSLLHLDDETFRSALMTPFPPIIHNPGTIILALLEDMGWQVRKPARNVRLIQDKFLESGSSSAVSWVDYDDNGYLDIFIANGGTEGDESSNHLYHNENGQGFTLITNGAIATDVNLSVSASWGDYDNDGLPDLFLPVRLGDNILYHNNGNGNFTKVTTGEIVSDGGDSWCASWGDYNNDGYLDLFVANLDQANFLYQNNKDGSFMKITAGDVVTEDAPSRSCAWSDFDNDGDLDLFVANSGTSVNFLYENNSGELAKVTGSIVVSEPSDSRGASWADYDNDGDLDLFVTNRNRRNFLYRNEGGNSFTDIESSFITTQSRSSRGSGWADFDNDGDLDLFVANSGNQVNSIFLNNGDGSFTLDSGVMDIVAHHSTIGCGWGDFDRDGDLDLKIANFEIGGIENDLFVNDNATGNNWINIRCVGTVSNRSAIGAKVRVKANINGQPVRQLNEISSQTGGGYGSQNSLNAEFGLGDATIIDSVTIEWPSGIVQYLEDIAVNQYLQINEGEDPVSIETDTGFIPEAFILHQNYPNPFNPSTIISFILPNSAFIELRVYNLLGQEIRELLSEHKSKGKHVVNWDGKDQFGSQASSGLYIYQINTGHSVFSRKMLLLR